MLVTLHQQPAVYRSQLAEKYGVSERTIFRDLNRLQPLVEHINGESYRLSPTYAPSLHHNDLTKLMAITGSWPLFAGQKIQQLLKWARQDAHPPFLIKNAGIEHGQDEALERIFAPLQQAVSLNRLCEFLYKNKLRRVEPYRLVNIKYVWYLAAMESGMLKAFRLGNIQWLTISDTTFTPDPATVIAVEQEDDAWFSLAKFEVQLCASADSASWFIQRDLLPAQKIISRTPDGSLHLHCKVADARQILAIVRYWLPHLTILSPAWLQMRLKQELEDALTAMNNNKENL
nr:WYL domain-containing protein [Nissabacter archeti]